MRVKLTDRFCAGASAKSVGLQTDYFGMRGVYDRHT